MAAFEFHCPRTPCCGVQLQGQSGVPELSGQEDERGRPESGGSRAAGHAHSTVCAHHAVPVALPVGQASVSGGCTPAALILGLD